ncbi:unnamed protein product [Echinostoma caproni]|uniref:G_PROTEIN_RECEP_F1_2 domain-containing protein n=1 Tax=Echinostoma caproni TaxID=27848 RepID=A0A183B2S4_9TREM|nr:unnamed protein product [Echinostoma caproni]
MFLTPSLLNLTVFTSNGTNLPLGKNVSYAYLYKALKDYFLQWYLPLVITLGFFGSVFCMVFLTRSQMFPKNMRIWLISICIGDFLILAMEGIWMLLKVWYSFDIRDVNDTLCILHTAFSNYLFYWSAYVQCFVSMQRCYLVLKPLHVNAQFLSARNLLICLFLTSVLLIVPILPYAIYWRVIDGDCDPVNDDIFRLTTVCDLVFWGLIPVVLMATSTVIIWRNLLQRRQMFDSLGNFKPGARINGLDLTGTNNGGLPKKVSRPKRHSVAVCRMQIHDDVKNRSKSVAKILVSTPNTSPSRRVSQFALPSMKIACGQGNSKRRGTDGNNHVTLLLICMNFVYMTSVYPLIIYFICLNFIFHSLDKDIHRFIYYLFRSFCFLNACSNWIFYCVAGGTFRRRIKHLFRLICCRPCIRGRRLRGTVDPLPTAMAASSQWSSNMKRYSCTVYEKMSLPTTQSNVTRSSSTGIQWQLIRADVEQAQT